jgi:excisionase family DNA binding protein
MNATALRAIDPAAPDTQEPTPTPPDGLLTADEVATLLQVTCAWVYAETRKRRIPHLRLGRYVRYRRDALEEWMHEIECAATERHPPARG